MNHCLQLGLIDGAVVGEDSQQSDGRKESSVIYLQVFCVVFPFMYESVLCTFLDTDTSKASWLNGAELQSIQ